MRPIVLRVACALLCLGFVAAPALAAAPCGGDFGAWLEAFEQEAAAQGVSERTIQSALNGVTYDPTIIARDHAQGVFRQSFEQFSGRMVPPRLGRAEKAACQYSAIFESHRAAVRRAGPGDRRHMGPRNRLRRRRWQVPDHSRAGDTSLRLPAPRQIPRRAARCVAHCRPRRHGAERNARRLGGRDRPDPVSAVVVSEIRRRL